MFEIEIKLKFIFENFYIQKEILWKIDFQENYSHIWTS